MIAENPATRWQPDYHSDVPWWHAHIPFAFWLIDAIRPERLVELGTHKGDSYMAFCQAAKTLGIGTAYTAIDNWEGDLHVGEHPDSMYLELKAAHDPLYGGFSRLLRSFFDEAVDQFEDGTLDLIHVDGTHTYEAVRNDVDRWLPKLNDRGVLVMHDVASNHSDFGVWKVWDEVRAAYPNNFTFTHSAGLGVAAVGEVPEGLRPLLSGRGVQADRVRATFAQRGEALAENLDPPEARAQVHGVSDWSDQVPDERPGRFRLPPMINALANVACVRIGGPVGETALVGGKPVDHISGGHSMVTAIAATAAEHPDATYLYLYDHETTIAPRSIGTGIAELLRKLETEQAEWLLASAKGTDLFNGNPLTAVYDAHEPRYLGDPTIRPISAAASDPLLVNLAKLRSHGVLDAAETPTTVNHLIAAGYARGLVSLFAPQLTVGKMFADESDRLARSFAKGPTLPPGTVATMTDLCCTMPTISIITRSAGKRLHLLRRLGVSIARAAAATPATIEWVIVGRESAIKAVTPAVDELGLPDNITPRFVTNDGSSPLPSRVANLAVGFEAATSPFSWIIDDDDYLIPESFSLVRGAFFLNQPATVVMTTSVVTEYWEHPTTGPSVLSRSSHEKDYDSAGWVYAFQGWNPLPICAYIGQTEYLQSILRTWEYSADLSEDYFLLVQLLADTPAAAVVEVAEPTVGISVRPVANDGVMQQSDRTPWLRDITSFMAEGMRYSKTPAKAQLLAKATGAAADLRQTLESEHKGKDADAELRKQLAQSNAIRRRLAAEIIRRTGDDQQ